MEEAADPKRLFEDTVVIDVGALEIIHATGADRIAFLHRLLTGDVAGTAVGGGGRSLLLNLKGHVVSDIHLFVLPDEVRMVVAPGQGEATATALSKYAIMDDFTATADDRLEILALYGPRSFDRLNSAGVVVPPGLSARPSWAHEEVVGPGGVAWLVRARGFGADGAWLFASAAARDALIGALAAVGVVRLDAGVAEALRIRSGEPTWGAEITPDYFPMEIGLTDAIDYTKGCYLGQEPIVRIRDRGHINWRLVGLRLRGDRMPAAGDAIESDVKPRAGRVTSAARLPGEAPVALAHLHTSVPIGTQVRVKHGEAVLEADVVEMPPTT